jgi:hypothetical protein
MVHHRLRPGDVFDGIRRIRKGDGRVLGIQLGWHGVNVVLRLVKNDGCRWVSV